MTKASKPVRTSTTDPLQIAAVDAGTGGGRIGITLCPGKWGPSAKDYRWERDLGIDLDVIAEWQPSMVLTLIEDHEFHMLKVSDLGAQVGARGIAWHHLPITDVSVPDRRFEAGWQTAGVAARQALQAGERVLVHCRGGLGRAGTIAARLLIELGADVEDAVRKVRTARPGAIETDAQLAYVREGARTAFGLRP
jgi:protein-tyrosine phosphatase